MVDGVTFFLTYPRFNIDHEEFYNNMRAIKPVVWCRVATEHHEDGGLHMHAAIRFSARVRGGCRVFDIGVHHPNIQQPRNINKVLGYVAKAGNYKDFGEVPAGRGNSGVYDKLCEAAAGGVRGEFDRIALEAHVSFQWAQHIWQQHRPTIGIVTAPGNGTECLQLQQLQLDAGTTVLVGPSGCGKTTWAKRVAPKPALFVSHVDHLRNFRAGEHKSIIFDDCDFKHIPRTAQIHLVDQHDDRQIHVRYGIANIPAHTTKIFTANSFPFIFDPAIERRIKLVEL